MEYSFAGHVLLDLEIKAVLGGRSDAENVGVTMVKDQPLGAGRLVGLWLQNWLTGLFPGQRSLLGLGRGWFRCDRGLGRGDTRCWPGLGGERRSRGDAWSWGRSGRRRRSWLSPRFREGSRVADHPGVGVRRGLELLAGPVRCGLNGHGVHACLAKHPVSVHVGRLSDSDSAR